MTPAPGNPTSPAPSDQPDRLDGRSLDLRSKRLAAIKALLPEAFDLDGHLVEAKLLAALEPDATTSTDDIPAFGLGWPGKQNAFAAAGVPTTATLRPAPDQSVDFDTTQNLLIEGDNLEVLKTLQRGYHGKVKMIYIDPPYNTGKDFVYPDNYGEGLDTYLKRTQQKDDDGFWQSTNSETSGRKHANWLSMMAPRLTLARNLLSDDGVIFISIDDNEVANLRMLCDEVFGAENFVASIAWEKRYTRSNNASMFYSLKDTILCFRRSESLNSMKEPRTEKSDSIYSNPDNDVRGDWTSSSYVNPAVKAKRPTLVYSIDAPDGRQVEHPSHAWKFAKDEHERHKSEGLLWWGSNGEAKYPRLKVFLADQKDKGLVPVDLWSHSDTGTTDEAGNQIKGLFDGNLEFDTPKPTRLLQRMLQIASTKSEPDIILDFFAGSGTTGHAVMAQNAADGGNRKYICVQLPEPLDEPVTLDDGVVCETIFDLTRERLKRAGRKIKDEAGLNAEKLDTGFRVFQLDGSNFTAWNSDPATTEADLLSRLDQIADHTVPGRTENDILWEVLLKMGLRLDRRLERFELEGATFIGVGDGTKVISTQTAIPTAAFEALLDPPEGDVPPSELVVIDSAFADDTARANVATLYKQRKDEDGQPLCTLKVV